MSNLDAKKTAFMEWLTDIDGVFWLSEKDTTSIVDKAAEIFGSFSEKVSRPMQEEMSDLTKKTLEYMQWCKGYVTDYDIANYIDKSASTAGARRRDLRKYGYIVKPMKKGDTWFYQLQL